MVLKHYVFPSVKTNVLSKYVAFELLMAAIYIINSVDKTK